MGPWAVGRVGGSPGGVQGPSGLAVLPGPQRLSLVS